MAEKNLQLARDAHTGNKPIAAENYLQHAEHYFRSIAAAQAVQLQAQKGRPFSAAAICRSAIAPAAWASRMAGATLANASAPAEWFALAIARASASLGLPRACPRAWGRCESIDEIRIA